MVAENKDPWETRFAELNNKILTLEKKQQLMSVPAAVQAMMEETEPLFTSEIMNEIQTVTDAMMCRGFSITLTGSARNWYRQLKPVSIGSFAELSQSFLTQFISGKKSWKPNIDLFTVKQESKESLKDYIAHFNEEALQVEDYNEKMTLAAVFSDLKEGKFAFSIGKNPPQTLAELVTRAQKYAHAEEFSSTRKNIQVADPAGKGKRLRNEEP
ncbi:uncharacterized protein LOC131226963 [Magnolia sinica]|uniref:uncharacterized protein LOC131226963 n=1 Tax=Magnolia sinica TaxID=86752 RepID=UPI00265A8E4C|nr:uncharacterized protein LOC131226963 [Magnolia sinica]